MAQSGAQSIYTEDGHEIPWFEPSVAAFLDRTTMIIGASDSGKTVIVRSILYLLRNVFPMCMVVAPSNTQASYEGIVPPCCMTETLTKEGLERIWTRQEEMSECFKIANSLENLRLLFERIHNSTVEQHIERLTTDLTNICTHIREDLHLSFAEKRVKIATAKKNVQAKVRELYKTVIVANKRTLAERNLSDLERITLRFIRVNPRLVLIIDDLSEEFRRWMRFWRADEVNPFMNIMYKGRHQYITLIFALQDDKVLSTEMRRSVHVSIYTTSKALLTAVDRRNGGYSSAERKNASALASRVFSDKIGQPKLYQKVCYVRDLPTPFNYTIAQYVNDEFKLGSKQLWELDRRIPQSRNNLRDNSLIAAVLSPKKKRPRQSYTQRSSRTKYS